MAAVLQTGSHLIKMFLTGEKEDERKSEVGCGEIESITTGKKRQGRKDECSGAERGLRWIETREREGSITGEKVEDMKEGRYKHVNKAEQDGDRDVKRRHIQIKDVQTSVVTAVEDVD